ncbi:MAG: S9 family peptidase [Alphaproteobacteria bacterium]
MAVKPPIAETRPSRTTRHGESVDDDYAWLRADNWQEVTRQPDRLDPDIRAYLEAENDYCEAVMKPLAGLREKLFAEMKARIKEDESSVPAPDGPYAYSVRYETGKQHPIFCRRLLGADGAAANGAAEEVLLDGNAQAEGHAFFRIGGCRHADDHKHYAYAVDLTGSEHYTIFFKDLGSGRLLDERIEGTSGSLVWAGDGRTIFYTLLDDNLRPSKVMRHTIGGAARDDALVYEEADPRFFVQLGATEDRRFVLISMADHSDTSEVWVIDAHAPLGQPKLFAGRESGVSYEVNSHGDRFLIRTNEAGAIDFKVAECPLDASGRQHWRDLVPHLEGRLILDMQLFAGHMVRLERIDGLPRIVVRDMSDGEEHEIAFDEEAYDLDIIAGYEYRTASLRFDYSSMTTPRRVYDYDMASRKRTLRKEQEIPSGHDPADYVTRRLMAESHDGALVPVSVLHRKGLALDGSAPLLLYGYGSYGYAMPASFSANRLSLVDRGFVYAIAHIRGGTDRGYRWYLDGKLAGKPNSFEDFIAGARHLADAGYTGVGRITAHGGSAGGLLVGAVANMAPELFAAIVAEVPFVDVVNTICDAELPLTPPEWDEWGNPIEDEKAYRTIRSYSPYDNVEAKDYPAMMVTAGVSDPRVTYWEPAKWVARLRALKTDGKALLLHTNMEAGHGGASGRFDRLEEVARVYAFVLMANAMAGL